ncbi:MAG: 30S ribosome-binding factor RbfA [Endozoicomonadaceae bacterium]|nr:30S ribosome-binding factor RbfA [Endozoicomonadaceae bacterium]
MFRGFSRTQRVADQIQRNVANILQMEMRDARLGMVTINEVKVSTDLSYADIYVTFMGIDDDQNGFKEQIKILTEACGYIRSRLGKMSSMRSVPALRFHYDESLIRAGRISSLIDKVIREDEKNRQEQKITNKDGSTDDQT